MLLKNTNKKIDLLGHLGYLLLFIGQFLIAQHAIMGWPLRIMGELIWLYLGVKLKLSSIWFWGIIFVLVESYGLYQWFGRLSISH